MSPLNFAASSAWVIEPKARVIRCRVGIALSILSRDPGMSTRSIIVEAVGLFDCISFST